jgi:hypothetical protein
VEALGSATKKATNGDSYGFRCDFQGGESVPWILACAVVGTRRLSDAPGAVPVFLPGEQVQCLFEVIGEVTVQGPFEVRDDFDRETRELVFDRVRLEVGREGAESGAHAVMVREVLYDEDAAATEDNRPEITSVEGMLLSFVDPSCVPNQ